MATIIIPVFKKTIKTQDGRAFTKYLSSLTSKSTGEAVTVVVKFKGNEPTGPFPLNIVIEKGGVNLSVKIRHGADGTEYKTHTLWVERWKQGPAYEDHSMDDFM